MRVIDQGSLRIAFVIDENKRLIASVSDGDIRRGLLGGINMDDSVSLVMNRSPHFFSPSSKNVDRENIVKKYDLTCVPIVSEDGQMIELLSLNDIRRPIKRENAVFIMAGGFGTRLKPLTDNCPKPMLPILDKPLLEHTIIRFREQGFHRFYISTHYLPDIIQQYFGDGTSREIEVNYVHEETPLGTGGALSLLPSDSLDLPVVMLNGDILTDLDFTKLLEFHEENSFDATMCLREIETQIAYGVVDTLNDVVIGMNEKPSYQHRINTGIYVVSPEFVKSTKCDCHIDMPTLLEERISQNYKIGAMMHPAYWLDIGRITDYQKAQRDIKNIIGF